MTAAAASPTRLVVVGAAAGIGRWLSEHVLGAAPWEQVVLIDTVETVAAAVADYRSPSEAAWVDAQGAPTTDTPSVPLDRPGVAVVLAVPHTTLPAVAGWLLPRLHADAIVVDCSHDRTAARRAITGVRSDLALVGCHALFGTTAASAYGQTFAVSPDPTHPHAHRWLSEAIEAAGGTVNELADAHHDDVMRFVQAAAHRALITFADVLAHSGLDLENDVWANRTPTFELLLALAGRVLSPAQESVTRSIQLAADPIEIAKRADRAQSDLDAAIAGGDEALALHLSSVRAAFSGGLFAKIQQSGVVATSAVQASRAQVAQHRRDGALVGVRGEGDRLHVGRVEHVSATSFSLLDQLIGPAGRATLAQHPVASRNAVKLGIRGSARQVEFRLGRIRILSDAELEVALDEHLATVARGCKFLVPDSISGGSALRVVEGVVHVQRAELVSEEIRVGQRACVVRFHARVDRDLADVERAIQARVDEVFVWPDGVVLPIIGAPVTAVSFLGPAGTFSDVGARQLCRLVGHPDARRIEFTDFDDVVGALGRGIVDLAVLPITSSSSGLVDLAAGVLLGLRADVVAGGIVDVPVRFDAYTAPGAAPAVGDSVLSHPQGIRQCSSFIAASGLLPVECTSTAEACRQVGEDGRGVALAAAGLGADHGLVVHRASVGNLAGALTRFLVLGRAGRFGAPARTDATMRSVWVIDAGVDIPLSDTGAVLHEVLRGPSGRALLVSTRADVFADTPGTRFVGTVPWSPRTPLVVV